MGFLDEIGAANIPPLSQFWNHTAETLSNRTLWVGYYTERQYGAYLWDAQARWKIFKIFDVRRHGAYWMYWKSEKDLQNCLKSAVPVTIKISVFKSLTKKGIQIVFPKKSVFWIATFLDYSLPSLNFVLENVCHVSRIVSPHILHLCISAENADIEFFWFR